jgi:hypothetical protein
MSLYYTLKRHEGIVLNYQSTPNVAAKKRLKIRMILINKKSLATQ